MIEEKITKIVKEKLTEEGFEDCFIVSVSVNNNSKVKVHIDCDSGLPIRKCVSVSRRIEHFLDESLVLGEKYVLEVSSPGLDNPLLIERQYQKNIGNDLAIKLNDETKIKGTLISSDKNGIVLDIINTKAKNSKKKNRDPLPSNRMTGRIELKFEDFLEAKVIVKFNKKKK